MLICPELLEICEAFWGYRENRLYPWIGDKLDKIIIHSLDQQPNPTARLNSKWSFSITHPFTLLSHAHILLIRFFLSLSHEPDHSGSITVWNTAQPAWRLRQHIESEFSVQDLDASYIRWDQRNWGKMTCC